MMSQLAHCYNPSFVISTGDNFVSSHSLGRGGTADTEAWRGAGGGGAREGKGGYGWGEVGVGGWEGNSRAVPTLPT